MSRTTTHHIDWIMLVIVVWGLLAVTPLSWWGYRAGEVLVENTMTGKPAAISYDRTIWRDIRMRYSVVVRRVDGNSVVCDVSGAVRTYKRNSELPDHIDMSWWAPGEDRCTSLYPPGTYFMETCWTAPNLLSGFLPSKTVCRTSNPFLVLAAPLPASTIQGESE